MDIIDLISDELSEIIFPVGLEGEYMDQIKDLQARGMIILDSYTETGAVAKLSRLGKQFYK